MRAAEILGVDTVRFIESGFAALTDSRFNAILAETQGDEGRLLLDEHEEPIALAFHGSDGWIAGSFLCRNPSVELIELFENVNGEIFQEDRAVWEAAVREYFSSAMVAEVPPSVDDLNPTRHGILKNLITSVWGTSQGETCIDCCCGSGVGSAVLRDLGFSPLSYDNDESLLSRGLTEKRLLPEETMWIDATIASRYIDAGTERNRDHDGGDQYVFPGYVGANHRGTVHDNPGIPHHRRDREGGASDPGMGKGDGTGCGNNREPC